MPAVTPEDEFRMLYHVIQLADVRPPMEELGVLMGLKKDATYVDHSLHVVTMLTVHSAWRYRQLMKRLKTDFDGPAPAQPAGKATNGRKAGGGGRKKKIAGNKRKASEDDSDASQEDVMEKKLKREAAKDDGSTEVKNGEHGEEKDANGEAVAEET